MPQVFKKYHNTVARVTIFGGLFGLVGLVLTASNVSRSSYVTKAMVPLDQPVPFSHKHHYEELGIDCRYCHWSVEKSAHAGVPSTEVCMSCHSQVWTNSPLLEPMRSSMASGVPVAWNKVNDLPDFVYFNHSIHINKGIGCNSCHSGIEKMHLTYKSQAFSMAWCLDCHRKPEANIRPQGEVFNMYYKPPKNQEEVEAMMKAHGLTLKPGEEMPTNSAEFGKFLVKRYNIHVEQLDNCSVCHR
ncbi:MAG: cytochrome c3 family protein [Fimbriimonadia bacterium]|nr:cytochrome c3 family protein [Fimbriimonadia bacterium]